MNIKYIIKISFEQDKIFYSQQQKHLIFCQKMASETLKINDCKRSKNIKEIIEFNGSNGF